MHFRFTFICYALAVSAASQPALADEVVKSLPGAIDTFMTPIAADGFSGIVVVSANNEILFRGTYGFADCAGREPLTPDHIMMIGSITKEFTQLLAYQLASEGTLSLDDSIDRFIPDLPVALARISIRQLVQHTAGLPDLVDTAGEPVPYTVEYDYLPVSREQLLSRFSNVSLIAAPGDEEEYSNLGYNVLAAIYEIASGETYMELLRTRIFEPAGMGTMNYVYPGATGLNFAEGCRTDDQRWGSPIIDSMWGESGPSWNLQGAGGLLGRADDLLLFFGALGQGKLLHNDMQQIYLDDRLVFLDSLKVRAMGPAGSNGIFNAVAFWAETTDLRVVVMSSHAAHTAESFSGRLIGLVARHPSTTPE